MQFALFFQRSWCRVSCKGLFSPPPPSLQCWRVYYGNQYINPLKLQSQWSWCWRLRPESNGTSKACKICWACFWNFAPNDSSRNPSLQSNKDDSSPHCRFHVYNVQDETKHSPPNEGQSLKRRFSPKVAVCEEAEAILDAQCATFSHDKANYF